MTPGGARGLDPAHRDRLPRLMEEFSSPFYFYDLDHLKARLAAMARALPPSVRLWYAVKANPLSAVLKVLRNLGFGMDVASRGELDQVLGVGVRARDVISTGPGKSREHFRLLLSRGVGLFVLESPNQAAWLDEAAKEAGARPRVLLRLQLDVPGDDPLLGGGSVTPFGVEASAWRGTDFASLPSLDVAGFHAFQWSNVLDPARLRSLWWRTGAEALALAESLGAPPGVLDLGGGVGVPYAPGERGVDFKEVGALLGEFQAAFGFADVWVELGRYVVAESGWYLTRVLDRKDVRGRRLLVTEGGINHMARPALTGQPFPASLFRESPAEPAEFRVHGPLCTALDDLGAHRLPEDAGPGDWLVFSQAGAYGLTESMPFFLCQDLPAEVVF